MVQLGQKPHCPLLQSCQESAPVPSGLGCLQDLPNTGRKPNRRSAAPHSPFCKFAAKISWTKKARQSKAQGLSCSVSGVAVQSALHHIAWHLTYIRKRVAPLILAAFEPYCPALNFEACTSDEAGGACCWNSVSSSCASAVLPSAGYPSSNRHCGERVLEGSEYSLNLTR
jgi:hypothetical protein